MIIIVVLPFFYVILVDWNIRVALARVCIMSTYCYRAGDIIYEAQFPMGEAPECIEVRRGDKRISAERDLSSEIATHTVSVKGTSNPVKRAWPMECYGSGVNADQAPELRKHLKDAGVPTEVTGDGNPVYTSAAHRKKALKARGLVDRSSFC